MKINKSKGKVHPSPSSSSSSSSCSSVCLPLNTDPITSLNQLLPATILTLISVLSLQDQEVLAYMITHSLNSSSTTTPSSSTPLDKSRKLKKSGSGSNPTRESAHKSPRFDCECFECYTAYWFRWDSSPRRELIHHAIEAFEDHLAKSEQPKKTTRRRLKDKEKDKEKDKMVHHCEEGKHAPEILPEMGPTLENLEAMANEKEEEKERVDGSHGKQQQQHKGLARKMLPDVMGFFNSRLWNLWGPNV